HAPELPAPSLLDALPISGTLASRWRPLLEPVLAEVAARQLVIDLRSGAYAGLGRVKDAVRVSVVTDDGAGQRRVVSHFNKAHKRSEEHTSELQSRENLVC